MLRHCLMTWVNSNFLLLYNRTDPLVTKKKKMKNCRNKNFPVVNVNVKLWTIKISGTVAEMIKKTLNADIPYLPWLTGYLAILMGAVLTFIVQSSSVFTSTLTPLVGVGLISVDRMYPLTLGSNLGTTTTAMIASLAAEGSDRLRNSLQIALCHFFFNLTGILLFYPIPFMRWPLVLCKILGRTTAQYRLLLFGLIH